MRRLDLNLLYTLRELLKEPNTTKVGERLGLTQSAISASLNRLRWAFQDELLVRSGRAMVPTKRAETLLAPVEEIVTLVEKLTGEMIFEPERIDRTFRICSAEYVLGSLLSPLLFTFRQQAPHAKVQCEVATSETLARMRSGHLDIALAPIAPMDTSLGYVAHELLYQDRLVCVAAQNHPEFSGHITADQFIKANHAMYRPDPNYTGPITAAEKFLMDFDVKLEPVCLVNSYAVLLEALRTSDLIATVPEKILNLIPSNSEFQVIDLPFDTAPIDVGMIWNKTFEHDPEHQWFRKMVQGVIKEQVEPLMGR